VNLQAIDWLIVLGLLATLVVSALYTSRYANSVSAFLAANRCGGRYLIGMAFAMAGTGVISLVYWFEIYYEAGFSAYWWSSMSEPALIVIALSGWIVYRFRQTRAMTLAQFFEMRYSRNFRVLAGLVAFISGIINFGIYPAVGARFFMALCGLPAGFELFGFSCSTFVTLMAGLLSLSILFTFLGGQIAVMVTDFIQGAFANLVFVALIGYLLFFVFRWEQIGEVLLAAPAGQSPIHPLKMSGQQDFDLFYFLIAVAIVFYTFNSWQGTSGYNCCAKDAHEAKMAGLLYGWRFRVLLTVTIVVPIAVMTLSTHPDFAGQAAELQRALDGIEAPTEEQRATLQAQLRIPHALALLLPPGLMGLVVAAMLAAFLSTHDTYLHSWGSIFVQDVVLPFRKRPLTPRAHLWLLRAAIFGVAVFIFLFSIFIKPTQFIAMFFAITGAVFVGGAGAAIIGGLYWSRGTTAGAWAAMLTGMTLSGAGVLVKQIDVAWFERLAESAAWIGRPALYVRSDLTGQELTFVAMCCAVAAYVVTSLLGPGQVTDMDALLHREKRSPDRSRWLERLGIDREFTRGDRWVAHLSVAWPLLWSVLFVAVTVWNLTTEVPDGWWLRFWRIWIWLFSGGAAAVTVWFTVGGLLDLRDLFRRLERHVDDPADDGRGAPPAQTVGRPAAGGSSSSVSSR
jgi:SSS family solute:Na+ symporter